MTTIAQWKARGLAGEIDYYIQPANGVGRRMFIAIAGPLTIKLAVPSDLADDDERLLPILVQRLEQKLFELLEKLTTPAH